ncbi:hypothetical protein BRARA_D00289 [Brassica rapa]|uniref:Uncharacterized protein n=1 Tax=Brassica campestris TaxID=3711 RepID=A0A397ZHF0_BRACM|nr:hypothetical protein BRARA_D00289 [Brassica rapa]
MYSIPIRVQMTFLTFSFICLCSLSPSLSLSSTSKPLLLSLLSDSVFHRCNLLFLDSVLPFSLKVPAFT